MTEADALTVLCLASYEKGEEFMRECHRLGCRVLLVTLESLRNAAWPREAITETFYMPRDLGREDLLKGVSHIARTRRLDRIVALDDFDVETAALLREHLRVAGMGETTARYFRDKLAERMKARSAGIPVPDFVHVLNDEAIRAFAAAVGPPWILKPRSQAAAMGMKRVDRLEDLWPAIDSLGDRRSFYLLERFVPGDVFHVDAIVRGRAVVFQAMHRYGQPPFEVAHAGGVFTTMTVPKHDPAWSALAAMNRDVLALFGMVRGVAHTEFIRNAADGVLLFLETSARVGGAHIVDLVEAETGLNLWREWARLEVAGEDGAYDPPPLADRHAGLVLTLARQERPDLSAYADPEIVYRVKKPHHAGLIVASADQARVRALVEEYASRFTADFFAFAPAPEEPPE
ncbi:MAG TPA: ATP-grasp domain-containing protein [Vicinamibacterales bacterium]|nr:ATP-grasp domain-containing protein [Vicinamibacterales bacterium]HOQ60192.1 ATP-grasp domain-containing protein [Vicinamibacterales bacterium]HPK71123.1 ATP-grasp domain-containing protein [Vicinamibacterales bacterium]